MVLDVRANRLCLLVHRAGPPVLHLGLIFGLRRFAYKAEQVGAESRNVEREALIDSEILRGQRCARSSVRTSVLRPETKPMTC